MEGLDLALNNSAGSHYRGGLHIHIRPSLMHFPRDATGFPASGTMREASNRCEDGVNDTSEDDLWREI